MPLRRQPPVERQGRNPARPDEPVADQIDLVWDEVRRDGYRYFFKLRLDKAAHDRAFSTALRTRVGQIAAAVLSGSERAEAELFAIDGFVHYCDGRIKVD